MVVWQSNAFCTSLFGFLKLWSIFLVSRPPPSIYNMLTLEFLSKKKSKMFMENAGFGGFKRKVL